VALFAGAARAHSAGLSRGEYRWEGAAIAATLTFARPELSAVLRDLDPDRGGVPSAADLERAKPAAGALFAEGTIIEVSGQRCPSRLDAIRMVEGDGVAIELSSPCGAIGSAVTIDFRWLERMPPGHRHLVHWVAGDAGVGPSDVVAFRGHSAVTLDVDRPSPPKSAWRSFFPLGVEHILTGYDHLLFLFGLILVGGRPRALIGVISAFTLAHSVSLALSVFDIWRPNPAFVEPAIALSIAYVGIENWFVRDASRRWRITFPFGLLHGFGFAGALRQIALPRVEIPAALLSFNLGVETGQLMVLAVLLPALIWARKRGVLQERGTRALSAVVAGIGLIWFVARVVDVV
jgi:hydrogenase/urease accessory protein HupE